MKKSLFIYILVLMMLSLSAFAAPARDLSDAAFENEELIAQVQPLADAVAAVAFSQGLEALSENTAPDSALAEGLLHQAYARHLQVASANEMRIELTMEEAQTSLNRLFFADSLPAVEGKALPALTVSEAKVLLDITQGTDYIGTHIFDIALDEEKLFIKADVYRLSGIEAAAIDAPEDSLVWLGALVLELRPEADSAVGFTLSAFEVKEHYQPTSLMQFTQKDRFELQYPDLFTKQVGDETAFLSLTNEDGTASLKVAEVPGTLEQLLAVWQGENAEVKVENDRAIFTAPGLVRLAYFDPQDGQDVCLVLEMNYPVEREGEFTLYRTFLDNSFVVYSHSVG